MHTEAEKQLAEALREHRRQEVAQEIESNDETTERARLEAKHGKGNVWNTEELSRDFIVKGFLAPFCVVTRAADGVVGSVEFQHQPRLYFNFEPDSSQK